MPVNTHQGAAGKAEMCVPFTDMSAKRRPRWHKEDSHVVKGEEAAIYHKNNKVSSKDLDCKAAGAGP